jgi:FAD/FMN-containing dehydrogenase
MDKRFTLEDQIEALSWSLKGEVIAKTHSDYDKARTVALGNYDRRPAALVRVANAADVAAVLNFVRATGLELAVRSGGHSVGGHSGSEGGIVIDLRALNAIEIDAANRTAWCGTGLTAGEVTTAVEQHGMIIGFGDSATVGIGGLTLGGGIGYMIRKHGLTIDNLLAAEVVTANGDIVIADADHHPDLFWALRGGGGNFGVVTRMKYRLHALPAFTGGPLVLPATAEVIAGFVAAAEAAPDELSTIALVMPIPPVPFVPSEMHGKLALIGMMAYSGDSASAQAALAPFRALAKPIADLVGGAPYSSLYMMDPPAEMRPAVSVRSRFVNRFGIKEAATMLAHLEKCASPMKMGQIRVLGGAFGRVAPEATAFAHRDSSIMLAFLAMYQGGADETAFFDAWADAAIACLRQEDKGAYVNFLGDEGKDGLAAAYPAATWNRLRHVKAKYDPENLFRMNQNIPPAA